MTNRITYDNRRGYVTLMSVLVVGAVAAAVAASAVLGGLNASRTSALLARSAGARALADACAEEALWRVRGEPEFTGSDTLSLGEGSCTYGVSRGVGSSTEISVQGFLGTIIRKARIDAAQESSTIQIISWQEVDDE